MRSPRRALIAPVLAAVLAVVVATPAGAQSSGVCSLLTRKEAGELLGAKVVKTKKDTSTINDAQECTYKTNKVQKAFKEEYDRSLKMQLEVSVEPLTDELQGDLEQIPFDDGSRVQGLGDEAYVTKFDQVIAVSGTTVVAAKLQNYTGASTKFREVSEGAVRTGLTRLDRVELEPPS